MAASLSGAEILSHPFRGITLIRRTESKPRPVTIHLARIDLTAPGISFELTKPSHGARETRRQTTLEFLEERHAQLAINAHFFLPFPSNDPDSDLIGLAASGGEVYSRFETPEQSYAIVAGAPALNLDRANRARIVRGDSGLAQIELWTTVAGSAQIITGGVATIPRYPPLAAGGPGRHSNDKSWYDVPTARTIAGLDRQGRTLFLFTVDNAAGSQGLAVGEAAELLIRDYQVWEALNLDGGGSTTVAIEDPQTHAGRILNTPSGAGRARAVGSSLAVFARPN